MGESLKAVLALILMVSIAVAGVAWIDDRPNETVWITRISASAIAILSLTILLKALTRRDLAPDYLQAAAGNYFNRDGFCFAFSGEVIEGVCQLQAHFQNQFELPCQGRIALRPASGFFLTRAKLDTIIFEISCQGGAYGVATLPIALPKKFQGKNQSFEVGASVEFPQGKGKRLRYRDGIFLRANTNFGNSLAAVLVVAGAIGGSIVLSKPAKVKLSLPSGVSEELPEDSTAQITTFWKLGDPLL